MTTVIEILQRQIDELRAEKNELKTELNQVRIELVKSRSEAQGWKAAYDDLKSSAERLANVVDRNLARMTIKQFY